MLANGDWQERNDIDGDGWIDLAGYGRGVVRPRVFWQGSEGNNALITAGVTYENREGGTLPGTVLPATNAPYTEALDTRRYDFGGSFQFLLQNRFVLTARLAVSTQYHNHRFGEFGERDRHNLFFGELAARGSSARQTWVVGVAAERDIFHPRDVPKSTYRYSTPGVFAQDDIEISKWLSVSASARADFHNRYGTFFSPRLSALLRWQGWTSRMSAGQGFFAPTPLTEETEAAGLSRLTVPAALVPERGRSASFDLTRNLGPVSGTVTLFRSTVRHPIFVERSAAYQLINSPEPTVNTGVGRFSGHCGSRRSHRLPATHTCDRARLNR